MKIRQSGGSFEDSMKTVREIKATRQAVAEHISDALGLVPGAITARMIVVDRYGGVDPRNGWDTHLITVTGRGPFGFTDSPL